MSTSLVPTGCMLHTDIGRFAAAAMVILVYPHEVGTLQNNLLLLLLPGQLVEVDGSAGVS